MPDTTNNQPLSRLDEKVDDLLRALGKMPNLENLLAGLRAHEQMVDQMSPDFPGAVDILAGTEMRRALINVMDEVLVLKKEADHGRS